jgi:sugar/nucleoside kinase (ribokinase family)
MSESRFDVVGIGNAIIDVLAHADDAFLARHSLPKGGMTLVAAEQAERLHGLLGESTQCSGGSAANTVAGLASLGGRGAYLGKVADDHLGRTFSDGMRATGVHYATPPLTNGVPTARSLIIVTPDAQRTMQTCLGASVAFAPEDVDEETIRSGRVTYLEGYLWDPPPAKQAFLRAARIAHDAGRQVALTLSDAFCVDRHRDSFLELVESHVDLLFANEAEIVSLYRARSFEEAVERVRSHCRVVALTRGEKGSLVAADGEIHEVRATPVESVIDTTGAGDLYAAGFLYGYTRDLDLATCGRLGAVAASRIIAQMGARSASPLEPLVREHLG